MRAVPRVTKLLLCLFLCLFTIRSSKTLRVDHFLPSIPSILPPSQLSQPRQSLLPNMIRLQSERQQSSTRLVIACVPCKLSRDGHRTTRTIIGKFVDDTFTSSGQRRRTFSQSRKRRVSAINTSVSRAPPHDFITLVNEYRERWINRWRMQSTSNSQPLRSCTGKPSRPLSPNRRFPPSPRLPPPTARRTMFFMPFSNLSSALYGCDPKNRLGGSTLSLSQNSMEPTEYWCSRHGKLKVFVPNGGVFLGCFFGLFLDCWRVRRHNELVSQSHG